MQDLQLPHKEGLAFPDGDDHGEAGCRASDQPAQQPSDAAEQPPEQTEHAGQQATDGGQEAADEGSQATEQAHGASATGA
jgi:hypothetical protein